MLFLDGNNPWQPLTNKRTGEFLAPKTLREKFGGLNIMKGVLSLDETPPALERSLKATTKLKVGLPMDLEVERLPRKRFHPWLRILMLRQNNDLDMEEFLGVDKVLQGIRGEFLNNMSKLTEIDKRIKRYTKNWKK